MAPSAEDNSSSDVLALSEISSFMPMSISHEKIANWYQPPDSKDVPPSSLVAMSEAINGLQNYEEQFSLYNAADPFALHNGDSFQDNSQGYLANCMKPGLQQHPRSYMQYGAPGLAPLGTGFGGHFAEGKKPATKQNSNTTGAPRNNRSGAYEWQNDAPREASDPLMPMSLATMAPPPGEVWKVSTQRHTVPEAMAKGSMLDDPNRNRTTLMIRNIPSLYTPETLLQEWPNTTNYDFFYLPFNSRLQRNLMYVFINFTSHEAALEFKARWQKTRLASYTCQKPLNIGFADVQGRDENLRQLKKKRLLHTKNRLCQPLVFRNGARMPLEMALSELEANDVEAGRLAIKL